MTARLFFDWNAGAPLRPQARAAMLAAFDQCGNPSSIHAEGRAARALVERARAQVAALVGCLPTEIIFTSGATEAAAMALARFEGRVAGVAGIEHACVAAWMSRGTPLPVDDQGRVTLLPRSLADPALALQAANSETGVMQPLDSLRALWLANPGLFVFSDITQLVGRADFCFASSALHAACLSSAKIGGPKGVGALVLRAGHVAPSPLRGGGQEGRQRPGTENLLGIVGFGAAAAAAMEERADWARVERLRARWEAALLDITPQATIFGQQAPRLPNTSCFAVAGWSAETQVMQLDLAGVALSAGSACASGKVSASPVIAAMGHAALSGAALRVSFGWTTTDAEVERLIEIWAAHVARRQRQKNTAA